MGILEQLFAAMTEAKPVYEIGQADEFVRLLFEIIGEFLIVAIVM